MQSIPFEQKAKDEINELLVSWKKAPNNFLLNRTEGKYLLKANKDRREAIAQKTGVEFPAISDVILLELYKLACRKYLRKSRRRHGLTSGFYSTPSERIMQRTLNSILRANPKLKHVEIYPSTAHSKDLPKNFKMVIGNYMPDFVVFGLKAKGSSAVSLEVNGDSHIKKWAKDDLKSHHLEELKVFTFEVENSQVEEIAYLTKALLSMHRLRNGSFNAQILRAKRAIWVKTVGCHLSLDEIESFAFNKFKLCLNLKLEAEGLIKLSDCPRKLKHELKSLAIRGH